MNNSLTLNERIDLYNKRNEYISKIWYSIAVFSVFTLLLTFKIIDNEVLKFPSIDLEIPYDFSVVLTVCLLSALVIRWMETYSRIIKYRKDIFPKGTIEIFNGFIYSSTLTVTGQSFLISTAKKYNKRWKNKLFIYIGFVYLILFRLLSILINFGLPGFALISVFINHTCINKWNWIIYPITVISLMSLFAGLITEGSYIYNAFDKFRKQLNDSEIQIDKILIILPGQIEENVLIKSDNPTLYESITEYINTPQAKRHL